MTLAQNSLIELAYKKQTDPDVVPAGNWSALRKNTETLTGAQDVLTSDESRSDRQDASDSQGNRNASGNIVSYLYPIAHDDLLESLMCQAWVTADSGAIDLDTAAIGNTLTRTSGSFITDGFIVGAWGKLTDAVNDGWYKITDVTALVLTLSGGVLVDNDGGGTETFACKFLTVGILQKHLAIEKRYRDIDKSILYKGALVNSMSVTMEPNNQVSTNFGLNMITEGVQPSAGTQSDDISTHDPYDSFSGAVLIDDVVSNVLTNIDFEINNGIEDGFVVGNSLKIAQFLGTHSVTGSASFYLEDLTEYEASIGHTSRSLDLTAASANGEFFAIHFPRMYWALTAPQQEAKEGPAFLSGQIRAKYDQSTGTTTVISSSI